MNKYSVNAEYYLYGEITLAKGGNKTARIEINSIQFGKISIRIPRGKMQEIKENLIYAKKGIHVRGKQDYRTGRPIRNTLEFVDFIEYYPSGVEGALEEIREREGKWLRNIDPDAWLNEIRGH